MRKFIILFSSTQKSVRVSERGVQSGRSSLRRRRRLGLRLTMITRRRNKLSAVLEFLIKFWEIRMNGDMFVGGWIGSDLFARQLYSPEWDPLVIHFYLRRYSRFHCRINSIDLCDPL